MYTSLHDEPPELQALLEALIPKKGVLQLKVRLLKGLKVELKAARGSGLTWLMIWSAMRDAGYPGAYPNFCRTAKALLKSDHPQPAKCIKTLAPLDEKKVDSQQSAAVTISRHINQEEKPQWQIKREQTMARLDRDAEKNREMEIQLSRPKKFTMTPFVGRGEG